MSPLTVARVGIGLAATLKALELWPVLIRLAGDPRVVQMPLAPWPRPSAAHVVFVLAVRQTLAMIAFAIICLSIYPLYFASTPPEEIP